MNKEKKNIPYILKNGPTHIENKRPISQVMKGRQTKLKCNTVYVLHPKNSFFFQMVIHAVFTKMREKGKSLMLENYQ